MASASRFRTTSAAEQEERRLNLNAEKTLKANKFASKIFKEYLTEKGENADFETFSVSDLDNALGRFYMDLRRVDGTSYKITSMEGIRHGINHYLKNPPFNKRFDIIKDSEFVGSNINFKAVLVELKRTGKGDVVHYPIITKADLQKLYSNLHMNSDTPQGLFIKVQFDVRLYFCRRGNENMHSMSKSTFNIEVDSESGLKYVKKIQDELTKNHRIDKESTSGVMPETPGSEKCPVVSFEKYISKLNPDCDRLWQKPKHSFLTGDAIWFCNVPVGEKKLKGFMSTLSTLSGLSKSYTNHSIRATGATLLSKNMFGPAQVMAVTGHRSVQSLTVYKRVDDHEKVQMGQVLSDNLVPTETNQVVPYSGPVTSTTSMTGNVPLQEISNQLAGINPDELFNDFEMASKQLQPARNNASQTPVLHNRSVTWINNLTINKYLKYDQFTEKMVKKTELILGQCAR